MILYIFLSLIPLVSTGYHHPSQDCSGFFKYENSCNQLILDLIHDWSTAKPIPSVKISKSLYSDCRSALECVKMIDCEEKNEEISKKMADLAELCSGIAAFSSSFGSCITVIQSKESSQEYPCLKYWNNPYQTPTCEFFESEYDCAEMIVENQCGLRSLQEMNMNRKFITEFFGCKMPIESRNETKTIYATGKIVLDEGKESMLRGASNARLDDSGQDD
ncbi:hypothetical protein GCK72_000956 [Caenorhabditis remanei]|uniref:T20D4.11-like domain-containing protein n=1 Tax=Caenorhabditis remanei TaxID=31234 RepID=A0A6A5HTN4_CAERE|nr:hypothetical protein GCK72_000956 [Caenorhabditis remanei]KAF1769142.1 hypothetical protein GCK72_000956 [Caenorhabditis remanei]